MKNIYVEIKEEIETTFLKTNKFSENGLNKTIIVENIMFNNKDETDFVCLIFSDKNDIDIFLNEEGLFSHDDYKNHIKKTYENNISFLFDNIKKDM